MPDKCRHEQNQALRLYCSWLGLLGSRYGWSVYSGFANNAISVVDCFFYLRSSYRLYCWLIGHKVFGSYINDYMEHRAVKKKAKVAALLFLWTTMTISIIFVPLTPVKWLLPIIGIAVSVHVLTLKTL